MRAPAVCTCLSIEGVALLLAGANPLGTARASALTNRLLSPDANCRWRAVVYDGSIAFFPGLMFFVQAIAPLCGIVGTCLLPKWGEELGSGG